MSEKDPNNPQTPKEMHDFLHNKFPLHPGEIKTYVINRELTPKQLGGNGTPLEVMDLPALKTFVNFNTKILEERAKKIGPGLDTRILKDPLKTIISHN